jgi:hypothetical protein
MHSRPALLYALHSGNLYGTERMALATLEGLLDEFDPIVFAPPGAALQEAQRRGIPGFAFRNPLEFALQLRPGSRATSTWPSLRPAWSTRRSSSP